MDMGNMTCQFMKDMPGMMVRVRASVRMSDAVFGLP